MMPDGSSLCSHCGLCCDGTLYARAKMEPFERERMEQLGLKPGDTEPPFFPLPCPRLSGTCCTIYERRFTICRSFRCTLLSKYLANEVTLEEAQGRVATAKNLLAKITEVNAAAATVLPRREMGRFQAASADGVGEQTRVDAAKLQLDIIVLERFLDRHFRKKRSPANEQEAAA